MIQQEFAAGYRKRAERWRKAAALWRINAPEWSRFNVEQVAALWEETACILDARAAEIEGTNTP